MKHRMTPRPLLLILILAGCCLLLGACGQTGPLYLPDDTGQTEN